MDLLKANLFRGGLFKQAKFLVSTPQRAESAVFISETGTISKEVLPMQTGYMSADKENATWEAVHPLKLKLRKEGESVQDAGIFLISERSYMPLDPFNKIKPKEIAKKYSLKDIARNRHAIERSRVGAENASNHAPLTEIVTYGSLIIIVLCILMQLASCGKGG